MCFQTTPAAGGGDQDEAREQALEEQEEQEEQEEEEEDEHETHSRDQVSQRVASNVSSTRVGRQQLVHGEPRC